MHMLRLTAATAVLSAFALSASADDAETRKELEDLKRHMAEKDKAYEQRISDLERRLAEKPSGKQSDLQSQIDDIVDKVDGMDAKLAAAKPSAAGTNKYIDVSLNS